MCQYMQLFEFKQYHLTLHILTVNKNICILFDAAHYINFDTIIKLVDIYIKES